MWNESNIEQLLQLFHGVFGILDGVADGSRVLVNFPIVATGECLVAEEVNLLVLYAR
jgi:hypothetical protein